MYVQIDLTTVPPAGWVRDDGAVRAHVERPG